MTYDTPTQLEADHRAELAVLVGYDPLGEKVGGHVVGVPVFELDIASGDSFPYVMVLDVDMFGAGVEFRIDR